MAVNQRKTGEREELNELWRRFNSLMMQTCFSTFSSPAIGNGGTAGRLRTNATTAYNIGRVAYSKASTDDLWNLSAETNTTSVQYRAYWLYLDNSGTASIDAGSNATSAANALKALPALTETKSIIGVYVAGPSTDFDAVGGLAAQGTVYNGIPAGAPCGTGSLYYKAPELVTLVPG